MRYIDITHGFYEDMPSYPASWYPKFSIRAVMTPETDPTGAGRTFTALELFAHNATHVDVPRHFFADLPTIDQLPLATFVGRACVADLSHKQLLEPITGDDLQQAVGDVFQPGDRLIVRTDYVYEHWGRPDFWQRPPYLTPSAADWAVANEASLIGLDCLTERPGDTTSPVHKRLLSCGVPILEYLTNLHSLSQRVVYLIALPTKISGVEASPVRAIAVEGWPGVAR